MKRNYFVLLLSTLLFACGPSKKDYLDLVNQNRTLFFQRDSLLKVITELEKEVDNYKYSAENLIKQAELYFQNNDETQLTIVVGILNKRYPNSDEYNKAQQYLSKLKEKKEENNKKIRLAQEAEEKANKKILNSQRKKYDKFSDITWYENPYFTHYNNSNRISIYMGKSGNSQPWLRLKISYEGNSWIFFDKAFLYFDGKTQEIPFDKYKDKKSDNSDMVWEWIDIDIDESDLIYLNQLVNSKSAEIKLSGKYTHTRTISKTEIKAIKDMITSYYSLKYGW